MDANFAITQLWFYCSATISGPHVSKQIRWTRALVLLMYPVICHGAHDTFQCLTAPGGNLHIVTGVLTACSRGVTSIWHSKLFLLWIEAN